MLRPIDYLCKHASVQPEATAFRILRNGDADSLELSWGGLHRSSVDLAAHLAPHVAAGGRVILVLPTGPEFLIALVACWQAGVVPVPLEPPRPNRRPERLMGVLADCLPDVVLTTKEIAGQLLGALPPGGPVVLAMEDLSATLPPVDRPACDLALLQYTSGSTGEPKGVRISHSNFSDNAQALIDRFQVSPTSVSLSWLPMFHDMGLVGHVITPMIVGCASTLMPPLAFIQRPRRWLAAIHRFRATHTGGPDHAWSLVARTVKPTDLAGLDLSCLERAYSGAEPVRPATMAAFTALTRPAGFDPKAWLPCYGLAEATLIVTGRTGEPREIQVSATALEEGQVVPATDRSRTLISCGRPVERTELRIHADGTWLPERLLGEVWVRSPGVSAGYFAPPNGTRPHPAFIAQAEDGSGPWLATGDLGFLEDGELFIAGRCKDLIIVCGRKHHPVDLEATAAGAHADLLPGRLAAFQLQDGNDTVVLLAEVHARAARNLSSAAATAIVTALCQAVVAQHDIKVQIELVPAGSIPTTSSGKIRRLASRQAWLAGGFPPMHHKPSIRAEVLG